MMRQTALAVVVVVLASLASALPAAADPYRPGKPQVEPKVHGYTVKPGQASQPSTGKPFRAAGPVWPRPATAEVALPAARSRLRDDVGPVKAAGLPVSVDSRALPKVRVQSFSRAQTAAAGVEGLLLRVTRADGVAEAGPAKVTVDYNAFRHAYGGDWASRLRLVALPECALSTPMALTCRGQELRTTNDVRAGTVTAPATVRGQSEGTLLAVTAAPEGSTGDYKATSLSPSATWNAGGNSGDFSWSYPLRVPPAVGGPAPTIALNYSSSSVDGRMASTNNQPSWIGEGFDWHPGYIERRYNSCSEDMGSGANNTVKTGDQCWDTDNATMSLPGHAGELIKGSGSRWHLRTDDGTRVERKTGASNGDNDGEWWVATTPDGTQYWFGGRAGSNSALVSTVFGNHSGEPCHQSSFAASHCNQAYRWQLDHVVDPHGNTMSFTYAKETNKYGRNNKPADDTVYDRAGYLERIDYGTRTGSTGNAPMQVVFGVADRCLSNCSDNKNWFDVPMDQQCTADTCAVTQTAPSFWTKKRLTSVTTRVWGGSSYRDVESWTLTHSFPDPTDSITPALWLDRISHTGSPSGQVGATTTIPDVTFAGQYLPNRVDTAGDQYPAMNRFRVKTITSESGGKLDVTYSTKDCVPGSRMPDQANLHDNALRCYPVKWTPAGHTNPINDFFHKYLVTDVFEADIFGSSTRAVTHYDYVGTPAWHYTDEDGMTKKDFKTWSVWRGYEAVRTTKGDPDDGQTREERRYFRGMHGDKLPTGTRSVSLPAIAVGSIPAATDEDAFAGQVRETITYNGPAGGEVSATVNEPWQSGPTATRTLDGTTVHSRFVNTGATHSRTALDKNRGHRTTSQKSTFDGYGMVVKSEDHGEPAAGDEKCTMTDYVRNTSSWIVDKTARVRVFAVDCATASAGGLTDASVVSDSKTSYDQAGWVSGDNTSVPGRGLVTKTETLKAYNGGEPTYHVATRATHDVQGRVRESWDIRGARTTTAYTPETGGPLTGTTETSHLGWVKSTTLEPAFNVPLATTDVNGRKVEFAYDGFGRLTQVWLANRDRASSASIVYEYLIRNNAPTAIVSKRLNSAGGYITSYKLHDSLLRLRQTQEPDQAGGVGAVVTDTFYDSAGRVYRTHDNYLAFNSQGQPVAPSTDTFNPTGNIPAFKIVQFDGAGRETAVIHKVDGPPASPGGTEKWRTTTAYGGDRTDVTPPPGGTSTSTIVNADGKTSERRDYHAGVAAGSDTGFDKTTFAYNSKDELVRIVDAAENTWEYKYDLQGRQYENVDPDKGKTTTAFTDYGDVESTTDGRGVAISYTYDSIGRKKTLHDGVDPTTGAKRAEWVYDVLPDGKAASGQLTKTIRYVGAGQYIKEIAGYTLDYKPTSVKYTIADPDLRGSTGSYTYSYTYHQDGSSATTRLPAMGDQGLEQLTHGYNALGKPTTLSTSMGSTTLVANLADGTPGTQYTSFGELAAMHLRHNGGHLVDVLRTYETDTRRLKQIWTTRQTTPTDVADQRFEYDPMGNVKKVSDLVADDHQCFTTDHLRQLEQAWTPSDGNCGPAPSAAALGGPSKYWHTYHYDAVGNRTKLVEHATTTGDRTTTYTVPAGKHQLTGTSTQDNAGTTTASYTYDASGNLKERPAPTTGNQTMTWDAEGHLATSTDSSGTTSYIYDVDGNRLVRIDPAGKTLYLPGQELRYHNGGAKKCTRYYTHADQVIAMRTTDGITWLGGDHHGTAQISVKAVGQAVAVRRETPFGPLRQTVGTWPSAMDKGFVGGTNDNTGLTHLGAREYDPLIGRFISVDPVIDIKDPQQMNGYNYASNAPVTASDPDGLWPKWLDQAANKVSTAAAAATSSVTNAVKAAGTWVYDNAGTISTVLSVAALACTVIPPLQVAAPFLGAAAAAVGAIETYKTCKQGMSPDCAMGMAELVPGGRIVGALGRGAKYADDVVDAAKGPGKRGDVPGSPAKDTCLHSFAPVTPVVMADGSHKAIGDIAVGDKVLATDPETGQTGPREVVALHNNEDRDLTTLTVTVDPDATITGDETVETIKTTWQHPFWELTANAWVDAADLKTGHLLRSSHGRTVTVARVHNYTGAQWMRDLTVAEVHTYFVVAGSTPTLVHNCGGKHRADGESSQPHDYSPRHGTENIRGHRNPSLWDKSLRTRKAVADGVEGNQKWDAGGASKVLGPFADHWWGAALSWVGRGIYTLRNAWKGQREFGYPAKHRAPESSNSRFRRLFE